MERLQGNRSVFIIMTLTLAGFCISSEASSSERHIFDDLTSSELQEVIDYLYSQPSLGLSREEVSLKSSYLRMVEAVNPTKKGALQYLDNDGPRPVRQANAILYRGDLKTPVVQELIIWPIPSPSHHKPYRNSKWRNPIPFSSRSPLNDLELRLIQEKMTQEIAVVDHILQEATGYSFSNCSQRCLDWAPGGAPHASPGGHKMLGYLVRRVEGKFLHPVGLQFVLNMEQLDTDQWTVSFVSWQGQEFPSFQAMKRAHDQGVLAIKKLPIPDNVDTEKLVSSLNFRGQPRPERSQRGRKTYIPDGDRFAVTGRQVEWLGWSFNFNVRSSTGIQLHDVRFLKERIAYELSLQELIVQYSGGDAHSSHTLFFDSDAMLGYSGTELFPGVDCPSDAQFFDTVHFHKGKPLVFRKTVCIFEWDRGIPLRRHYASNYDGGYVYYQGMPDIALVVRTIPTIDNYDYVVDVMFHQDGKIEVKTSLTGYLVSTLYQGPQLDKYGYVVNDKAVANLHVHLANFKVDLDVAGTDNRLVTLDLKTEQIQDSLNPGKTIINRWFEKTLKETEKEAAYHYNFETPKYLVFTNEHSKNKYGNPRGYRLHISDAGKLVIPPEYRSARSFSWAQYQMAVTKYDEEEHRSSSLYNFMEPYDPIFTFQDYIDNDQNIVDKDLVAWVTLTAHHIPHSEDVPIVTTPGVQLTFYLLPYNYLDEDPSLASRDNIRVEPAKDHSYIYHYSGVPMEEHCHHDDVDCRGVIEVSSSMPLSSSIVLVVSLLAIVLGS